MQQQKHVSTRTKCKHKRDSGCQIFLEFLAVNFGTRILTKCFSKSVVCEILFNSFKCQQRSQKTRVLSNKSQQVQNFPRTFLQLLIVTPSNCRRSYCKVTFLFRNVMINPGFDQNKSNQSCVPSLAAINMALSSLSIHALLASVMFLSTLSFLNLRTLCCHMIPPPQKNDLFPETSPKVS